MSDLPKGWAEAEIGELATYVSRGRSPKYVEKSALPVINQRCVRWHGVDETFVKFVDPATWHQWDDERLVRRNDILWNSTGTGTIGRAALFTELPSYDRAVVDSHVTIVRAGPAVDPAYLFGFIKSPAVQDKIEDMQSGSTNQVELNRSEIVSTVVPVAPLSEQRRIVAKVDGLTARTARARKDLDRIPTLIARYKQRLLALAFSGELIGARFAARQVSLASITLKLDQGWSPKCENFPSEDENLWGVIKTTAVQPIEFLEAENKQLPAHLEPRPKIEISAGEILVTRAGPRNRVGITCLVRNTRRRLMLADKVYRLRVDLARADPLFVTYMLNSPDALTAIEAMKSGGSESGLNLTQDKFLGLGIPIPPLEEQAEIVRRIESAFGWLDRMAADHAAAARLLPKLDAAILTKAFRGELVPQDPTDEPASVLLERIRAEREARPVAKRGRKAKLPPIFGNAEIILEPLTLSATGAVENAPKTARKDPMTKSRQDDDVKDKPYLAGKLTGLPRADVQTLFGAADLPVADFYKQLAWEIGNGHIVDSAETLKAA